MELAGHRIGEALGAGAMALLQRAVAPDGSERLLKRPKLGMGSHPACLAGFELERMILARLTGPHAPRLVAAGEDDEGPWLIEERVEGTSLAELARRAPLPVEEVSRCGAALAQAVHELHRQNVVHHDLKPSHVLLREGVAVILDYGLACHGELPDYVAGEADRPLGTPAYIAPEALRGRRGDPRSDIFSLGVILYLLATGRLPFGAPDSVAGMRRRLWLDPPRPRALRPELPEWLQEIIQRCLAVRVDNRYPTAALVAHDLRHPEQVAITQRGRDLAGGGWRVALRRWWQALNEPPFERSEPARQIAHTPHLLVAVDAAQTDARLAEALRATVRRLAADSPALRISCVTVLETALLAGQDEAGELGDSLRTQRLVALRHWARELGLPAERLRFHVLVGGDAASALLDHAATHQVDHLVIGARGSSALRRLLGSVSARVAAEAPCTVTVVRSAGPTAG